MWRVLRPFATGGRAVSGMGVGAASSGRGWQGPIPAEHEVQNGDDDLCDHFPDHGG